MTQLESTPAKHYVFLPSLPSPPASSFSQARVGPKKFQKVILTVSPRGLSLQDAETKETIESVSIYRCGARMEGRLLLKEKWGGVLGRTLLLLA